MSPTSNPASNDNWIIATGADTDLENEAAENLINEAKAAAPDEYLQNQTMEFLPRRRLSGRCRICGQTKPLTKEHIPPQSVGNAQRTVAHSFSDWLSAESLALPGAGRIQQGGIWGYTLCRDCNSYTGTHYPQYQPPLGQLMESV